jgi:PadR family transcriptional regulator, regulatory protein PadR
MVWFRRPSERADALVLALAEEPATWWYGSELCQRLGLDAGALYPALMRLADRGLLETAWESEVPTGRAPRHRYRLTGPGRVLADRLAAEPPARPTPARAVGRVRRRPHLEGT